jgi:hypothetical protein
MRKLRVLIPVTLTTLLVAGGGAYAALNAVPATATDAVAESSASVVLSPTGGVPVTVTSLSLPAGAWVLSSEATLVSWSLSDYTRCQIVVGTTQIASGTTMVGDPAASGSQGASTFVADRGLMGVVRRTAPFTASLRCQHDHDVASPPFVDAGAVLVAHKSDSLYGTTR